VEYLQEDNMNKLFFYRKMAGLRQIDLAMKLGIKEQTISCYETGRLKPSDETALKISEIFGVDVSRIFPKSAIYRGKDNQNGKN
jgi:DNA-binding XRE family transcriptional regulator